MNSQFNSVFLSKITVTQDEIVYSEKKNSGRIKIKDISEFDVTEGTFTQYGHLRIVENGTEHKINFVSTHNKGLRALQKELGFYNVTESKNVKEERRPPMTTTPASTIRASRNDIVAVTYNVTGKNPKTGRKKSQTVVVSENASESTIIERSGLEEPCEIVRLENPPTDAQILYAKKLGIQIPGDATSKDVSVFLTRAENNEPIYQKKANREILSVLIDRLGIYIPAYAGDNDLNGYYWAGMSKAERYAYFAMRVYAENVGKNYRFLFEATNSEQEMFKNFSEKYMGNSEFENSFNCYVFSDVPLNGKIKKRLKAYQIASAFFMQQK